MMESRNSHPQSQFIEAMDLLQAEATKGDLTLRRIVDILGEECHAVLLLFIAIPSIFPVQIPGLSTPVGLIISAVAIMLYMHRPPWIPKRYESLKISAKVVIRVSEIAEKIWKKLSRIVKERWVFLHDQHFFRMLNLVIFVLNACLLALPLPIPFTNTVPGIAIVLCALGHVEKDGLFILLSYLWTLLVISFFTSLAMGAKHFF